MTTLLFNREPADDTAYSTWQTQAGRKDEALVRQHTTTSSEASLPAPQTNDGSVSVHHRWTGDFSKATGEQAVVFKTMQVTDKCKVARFLSLVELTVSLNMDVWLLHDAGASVAEAVTDVAALNAKVFIQPTPTLDPNIYRPDGHHAGQSKSPFALWLSHSNYSHAWYLEDDFVYTGNWTSFFSKASEQAQKADLVAKSRSQGSKWLLAASCQFFKKPCLRDNHLVQTLLALFRMSRRFAVHWLKLRAAGDVRGHCEAIVAPICDKMVWCVKSVCEPCVMSDMFNPGGVYDVGGWGLWRADESSPWRKTSPAYTLTGLAALQKTKVGPAKSEVWTIDFSKYKTNDEVPRNHLFHPCKCEAENHWDKAGNDETAKKAALLAATQ